MRLMSLLAAFGLAMPGALLAQESPSSEPFPSEPITIGTSYTLETHEAARRINVIVPHGYGESEDSYPILLMLDGGVEQDLFLTLGLSRWNLLWGRSEPVIFVGVETVDRQRELLPPTSDAAEQERYPSAGESAQFRDWLIGQVLPMLRANYRSDGRAFLAGESAAGHFVAETWALHTDLFDGYAAISPSMQWSGSALAGQIEASQPRTRPPLYISLADEGGATETGIDRLVAKGGEEICFSDRRTELVHANSLHALLPEALQYLLPTGADWLADYGLVLRCDNRREAAAQSR